MMSVERVAIFWVVMRAVVKKVVYSFRYRLGPGQVGREVFHIVLKKTLISYGRCLVNRPSVVKSRVEPVISVIPSDPSVRNLHS